MAGLAEKVWARWRLLLLIVVVTFALNNLLGLVLGGAGFIALAHRIAGRLLRARTVIQQVGRIGADPGERGEGG